jgi:hypothetical protein
LGGEGQEFGRFICELVSSLKLQNSGLI